MWILTGESSTVLSEGESARVMKDLSQRAIEADLAMRPFLVGRRHSSGGVEVLSVRSAKSPVRKAEFALGRFTGFLVVMKDLFRRVIRGSRHFSAVLGAEECVVSAGSTFPSLKCEETEVSKARIVISLQDCANLIVSVKIFVRRRSIL